MNGESLNKVAIIGAGSVGATCAYTLMQNNRINEISLIDKNPRLAEGHVMDLNHGLYFTSPKKIVSGDYEQCRGADVIIITAGAAQKDGETRLDLLRKNSTIITDIIKSVMEYIDDKAIILMVSNPVDILTYVALKVSGLPAARIIGSGTVLDTSRLRYFISSNCSVDARNVHGYVVGEHGDSEFVLFSRLFIGGILFSDFCGNCNRACPYSGGAKLEDEVRRSAYNVIEAKGATYYAVSLAVNRIVNGILGDENSILTVSTMLSGQYGINDVCVSVPVIVNRRGAVRVLEIKPDEKETKALADSVKILKSNIKRLFSP